MRKTSIRIIAVLEAVGGVSGIGLIVWLLLTTPLDTPSIILAFITLGIYLLSLLAGVSLWRGRSFGRKASVAVQLIQLPKIFSPQLIFVFSFGLDFWLHYVQAESYSNAGFEFRFLAFHQLFWGMSDAPLGFGVSIVSLISLLILFKYRPGAVAQEIALPPPPPMIEMDDNH